MGRRKYPFDEAKTQRFIAEGRGTGEGPAYRPWLEISDLPSLGRSHRPWSPKTNRVHQLLSDGEWKTFLMFEADQSLLEIREGLPLDRWQTHRIALEFGYRPPLTTSGTPYVLTIDFLVTRLLRERRQLEAYSFKYDTGLLSKRDWELHKIAEECLRRNGVPFGFIDQTFFNEHFEKAYDSVRACFDLSGLEDFQDAALLKSVANSLLQHIRSGTTVDLLKVSRDIARTHATTGSTVFTVAKHLIARDQIRTDLSRPRDLTEIPLSELIITSSLQPWLSR